MQTRYEQIVNVQKIGQKDKMDLNAIIALAENENLEPVKRDTVKRLFIAIDPQEDFMEGGALGVAGANSDVERMTKFLYDNMEKITKIVCSLDTHVPYQIFHPCWWVNFERKHPEPYTVITYEEIKAGKWRAVRETAKSHEYVKRLEQYGKKKLCIWPYHCIQGTYGANLENEFAKMVHFHSIARKSINVMITKGLEPCSEMYGIIEPEFSDSNIKNTSLLNLIEIYDEVYVVGEAASHCVLESLVQIAKHFGKRPDVTKKIVVLEDCMSSIPGFEAETAATFKKLSRFYGIKFMKSTDIELK